MNKEYYTSEKANTTRRYSFTKRHCPLTRILGLLLAPALFLQALVMYIAILEITPRALEYYLQGLKLAEEMEDIPRQAALLNSLGLVYFQDKDYDKALDFFQRGLALSEELGYDLYISACVANIADIHTEKGDYEEALQFHTRSLELERKQQNLDGEAQSLTSLGNCV